MKYARFPGTDVIASRLGYGCMRLPTTNEENHPIDRKEAIRLLRHGIDNGITYVDTAYGYHDGRSEVLVGEALKDGYREKVTLTTKLPLWAVHETADMERLLDEQLTRLKLDYVELIASDSGYPLYRSLGFEDATSKYHPMKYVIDPTNSI